MSFDSSSRNYLNSSDHRTGSDLEYFAGKFGGTRFERALDIACAAGHFAQAVNADTKIVCDMSLNMLKTAGDAFGLDISAVSAAEFLPFAEASFDFAGCRIAMHHFRSPCMFMGEVFRVLKEGGIFVLIDSVVDEGDEHMNRLELVRDETHRKSHTADHIIAMAECEGFEVKDFALFHKRHNFSEWADRLNPSAQLRERIESEFLSLPEDYKQKYRMETENGRVVSYTDKKGFFIFMKP
ncbi:class I SAM-dependent methyltransferase [Seleniivibrio woodruffii]|uniref:Methyltransferase family protein n=1 Tax=Seleniivibrio woodruffii TaxID=1078050 RepID=A0A4R1KD16_9BACT|nr:class I SAM-dependent methyltransferase [Seleniivibrio woodruffii]TCK61883.1 methyltransferase family protein [Seleniivibrio woodruffii]TVZ35002.1 methyltransferase family protein [Seleniivibrio woodruffii]